MSKVEMHVIPFNVAEQMELDYKATKNKYQRIIHPEWSEVKTNYYD